jgi:2,3-bisphosphoglycerate-independent phosphoglycerate mutase
VGHTGVLEAAVQAVQTVDGCVGRITEAVLSKGGALLITADHGNAETMIEENGRIHTAHTTHPVHLLFVDNQRKQVQLRPGVLGDIAPTILDIMGIAQPRQMTGQSLMVK